MRLRAAVATALTVLAGTAGCSGGSPVADSGCDAYAEYGSHAGTTVSMFSGASLPAGAFCASAAPEGTHSASAMLRDSSVLVRCAVIIVISEIWPEGPRERLRN